MSELRLGRAAPTLPVEDVERAARFYAASLGFELTFETGAPISYAVLKKDDAEVHLSRCSDPSPRAQSVMHLLVSDADAALARCLEAGALIVEAIRDAPWGIRTFVFEDLDGNRVDIGQPLER